MASGTQGSGAISTQEGVRPELGLREMGIYSVFLCPTLFNPNDSRKQVSLVSGAGRGGCSSDLPGKKTGQLLIFEFQIHK